MSEKQYSQLLEKEYACPQCKATDIGYDSHRAEIYCRNCGLIISSPTGGAIPYDFSEARTASNPPGDTEITNYKHTITNRQLMRHR